jgi:transcriptional regulator with XRE-family HTH domain
MNRRLQQFLAAENISQSQFADTIGVARANISHILAGRNKPGFDFIERMARAYPALSLEWLITGRGRMYSSAKSGSEGPAGAISPLPPQVEQTLFDEPEIPAQTAPKSSTDHLDNTAHSPINQRSISKIILFYTDGTFQELP